MVCDELFKKIDELNEMYVDVWENACNIESPTNYKEGVDTVGNYFSQMSKERGWKVERSKQAVSGDVVCITMNPESAEKPISLSGHIDTVHPVGMFGTPAVHRDSEKIYGPGVSDCKGGVVAGFLAMDALHKVNFKKRPVQLLLQTDEEKNSMPSGKATINYICEKAKDSVAFLNLESHGKGTVTLVRKGIVSYEFEVTGKEGHSSRCVTEGANAIVDAAYKIIELDKLKDDDGITCNCAIINGGTVVNTIPGKCIFSVNFRYATNQQYEWIEKFVNDLASIVHVPGCSCSVKQISRRVAMEMQERNVKLLEKVNKILAENNLETLIHTKARGGSDGADVTAYGIPCIDSLGVVGGGTHSINEYALFSSLTETAKRIAAIAYFI